MMDGIPATERGADSAPLLLHHDDRLLDAQAVVRLVERCCVYGQEVYVEPSDSIWRRPIPGGPVAWWKEYRYGPLRGQLQRFIRSRADREWVALAAMRAADLPAARPISCLEWRRAGGLQRSVLVTEEVAGTRDLAGLAADPETEPGFLRQASRAAGRLVRRMHDAGFVHFRMLPRNVLVDHADPDAVTLLDAPYVRYWAGGAPAGCRRYDLATFTAARTLPREISLLAVEAYGRGLRADDFRNPSRRRRKAARLLRYTGATLAGRHPRLPA